jgi:hypothetical protein
LNEESIAKLEANQTIYEQPFRSNVPIVGRFIAWFRATWNSVSTRWYVLPLLRQQNEFNALVVSHLREGEKQLDEMDGRLIDLDRDHTLLTRNVAELTYQLMRMNRLLTAIEARLQDRDTGLHEV